MRKSYNVMPSSYRACYILSNIIYNMIYNICCQSYKSGNLDNWTLSVITKSRQLANLDNLKLLYFVTFQSHGGRGLCFIYLVRKGWNSVETTGFHMLLFEACHVKKMMPRLLIGLELNISSIDYACPQKTVE